MKHLFLVGLLAVVIIGCSNTATATPTVDAQERAQGLSAIKTVTNYKTGVGTINDGIGIFLALYESKGHAIDKNSIRWTYQKNNDQSYSVRFYFTADGSEKYMEWLCSNQGIITPRNDLADSVMGE